MATSRGDPTPHCTAPQHTYNTTTLNDNNNTHPTPHAQLVTHTSASHHTRTHHLLPFCAPSCLHLLPFSPVLLLPPCRSLVPYPPSHCLPCTVSFSFTPLTDGCFHADVSPFSTQHVQLEMRVHIFVGTTTSLTWGDHLCVPTLLEREAIFDQCTLILESKSYSKEPLFKSP